MRDIDSQSGIRKFEREHDLPPLLTPEDLGLPRKAERRPPARPQPSHTAAGAALRLSLVIALAAGINFWPYSHACGPGLFALLATKLIVVVGGIWVIVYTWQGRMARAHAAGLLIVLWGLVLLAGDVLPRVGYARTSAPVTWMCTASPQPVTGLPVR